MLIPKLIRFANIFVFIFCTSPLQCVVFSKASISLACKFLATVLRILSRTFARNSCECRTSVVRILHVSRTGRELVAKVLNMFKNFMRIFSPTFLCECREPVAAKFWRIYNAKCTRHLYECRASVERKLCLYRQSFSRTSLQLSHYSEIKRLCYVTSSNF